MGKKWHVAIEGKQHGPFAELAIHNLLSRGRITEDSYVWCQGMEKWKKLKEIKELHSKEEIISSSVQHKPMNVHDGKQPGKKTSGGSTNIGRPKEHKVSHLVNSSTPDGIKQYIPHALALIGLLIIVLFGVKALHLKNLEKPKAVTKTNEHNNQSFTTQEDMIKEVNKLVEQMVIYEQGCMFIPRGEKITLDTTDSQQDQDNDIEPETIYPEEGEVSEISYNIMDDGKTSVCIQLDSGGFIYLVKDEQQSFGKYFLYFDGKSTGKKLLQGKNEIYVIQDIASEEHGTLRRNVLHKTVMVMSGKRP